MLVVMKNDATEAQIQAVVEEIEGMGTGGCPCREPSGRRFVLSATKGQ